MGNGGGGLIILVVIIAAILIWGFVGGMEASSPGVTCDMGLGDTFCFQWHTNTAGKTAEFVNDLFG